MISFCFLCAVLVAASCWQNVDSESAPSSSLPNCKAKSSNVNECLKTFLQGAIKRSHKGSAMYRIPPLDPYFVPKISMTPNKNLGINIEMRNTTSHGFSKALLTKVKADPLNGYFEVQYVVPVSTLLSIYNLSGKIFNMPINGQGKSNITFYDVSHELKIKGDIFDTANGVKQFVVSSVGVKLKPKKMKFKFEKLFKENKELGDVVNQMMNENWQDLFVRLQPKMEEDTAKHLQQLLNDFFSTVSYNKIFPDV